MISLKELTNQISTGKLQEGLSREEEQVLVDLIDDAIGNIPEAFNDLDGGTGAKADKWMSDFVIANAKKHSVTAKVPEAAIRELINREY